MTTRKRIAIVGGWSASRPISAQQEYVDAFQKYSDRYEFVAVINSDLVVDIAPGHFSITYNEGKEELSSFDAIILRGKSRENVLIYALSRYAHLNNIPIANDFSLYLDVSKLTQTVVFYEQNAPFIRTLFCMNKDLLARAYQERVGYPGVFKAITGAQGENNYLLHGPDDLAKVNWEASDYIAQPLIENDGDFRVLVQGNVEPLQIFRKAVEGSHLNNTSQGATATIVKELPFEVLAAAQRTAQELGLIIAGVDVMHDKIKDEYVFLEVNSHPQILTGSFTDEKITQFGDFLDSILVDSETHDSD